MFLAMASKKGSNPRKDVNLRLYPLMSSPLAYRVEIKPITFTQNMENRYYLCTCMNDTALFFFCRWQRDFLLFLSWPNQWSNADVKHRARSGIPIIIVSFQVGVGEVVQQIWTFTISDTKMSSSLVITNNIFYLFRVALSRILHKMRNHTNRKVIVRSIVSKINETVD